MSVAQAQREIDSQEFSSWQAFARVEPFGEERDDLRSGIIAATIANVNRAKAVKPFEPRDFMPRFDAPRLQKQTPDEMLHRLTVFAEAHNAGLKR